MASVLTISRLLTPDRALVGLKAKTLRDAVKQLLDRLDEGGAISDREALDTLVDEEIARGEIPTLGKYGLLAHFRSEGARNLALAIGVSSKPFAFAPPRTPDAQLLALVIGPRAAAREYLKTLAGLSRLLEDPEDALRLARARKPQELLEAVALSDVALGPELTVQDLMSRDLQTVSPETPLSEVLRVMVRHRRRELPVVSDNGEVLGIVSQQDLLEHFLPQVLGAAPLTEGELPSIQDVEVRKVMQRSVLCLTADQLIADVVGGIMKGEPAQFPVVSEGKLIGILSRTDILEKLLDHTI